MGTSLAIPIVLLVVIGLVLGSLFNFAAGFLAIPIVAFLLINFVLAGDTMDRHRRLTKMRKFRQSSRARKSEFSEQDRRTVV